MKIIVAGNCTNGKGLQKDYELLRAFLVARGHEVVPLSTERPRPPFPTGDLLICLETIIEQFFELAPHHVAVLNPEWLHDHQVPLLDRFDVVACKTKDALRIMRGFVGDKAVYTGWRSEDRLDKAVPRKREFLHVAGGNDLKGTSVVIEAWKLAKTGLPLTLVGSVIPRKVPTDVKVYRRLDDRALRGLQNRCLFHLCPSEYEGFGHTIWEGLSCGATVFVPAAPPLNEIEATVKAEVQPHRSMLRAAALCHVEAADLAAAMSQMASGFDRVEAATAWGGFARAEWEDAVHHFEKSWEELLEDLAPKAPVRLVEPFRGWSATSVATEPSSGRETGFTAAKPRLSICMPAHVSGAELLKRSLLALNGQTCKDFEVCIGIDGGTPSDMIEAFDVESFNFDATWTASPRPRGDHPHRNHARNAALRAAKGELVWFIDADFLIPPHAVEHILALHDASMAAGRMTIFTTCLCGIGDVGPEDWIGCSRGWASGDDEDRDPGYPPWLTELLSSFSMDVGIYSGFADRYTGALEPTTVPLDELPEGMPILPRELANVLGGFDEDFGEWGGDKEEFVDRLKGIWRAGLVDLRLITSVMAWHQPHAPDPMKPGYPNGWNEPPCELRRRWAKREQRARFISTGAAWWRTRLQNIKERMPEVWASLRAPVVQQEVDASSVPPAIASAVAALTARPGRTRRWLVLGRWGEQMATRLRDTGLDAQHSPHTPADWWGEGIVSIGQLGGMSDDDVRGEAASWRHLHGERRLIIVERTKLGSAPGASRSPYDYQRLIRSISPRGTVAGPEGPWTVFNGKLT